MSRESYWEHLCRCLHMCMHVWNPKVDFRYLLLLFLTLFLETESLIEPRVHYFGYACWPTDPAICLSLLLRCWSCRCTITFRFYVGPRYLNAGPHAHAVSTLPPEPFSQPSVFCLYFINLSGYEVVAWYDFDLHFPSH